MLDRILAFLGVVLLVGLSGLAVAASVEVQSVILLFATLIAFTAVAGFNENTR